MSEEFEILSKKIDALAEIVASGNPRARERVRRELTRPADSKAARNDTAENLVRQILLDISAGEHLLGFPMLEDAILARMNGEHQHIYKTLAVKYGCTVPTVERRIRSCINYAFQNGEYKVLNGYLHGTVSAWREKDPNYVFFARIARAAQEKLEWGEIDGN